MSNAVKGLTIQLGMDGSEVTKSMNRLKFESRQATGLLRELNKSLKLDPKSTELLAKKHEVLGRSVSQTENKLAMLRDTQQELLDKPLAEHNNEWARQLDQTEREILKNDRALKRYQEQLALTKVRLDEAGTGLSAWGKLHNVALDIDKFGKSLKETSETIGHFADAMGGVANFFLPAVIAGAGGLTAFAKSGMEFEDAWTGVRKTIDGSPEQMSQLRDSILSMSREMPIASENIAQLGESAGQLGVPMKHMDKFIDTMARLEVSTNIIGEQGSMQLARFLNIVGKGSEEAYADIDKLGSVIVELGNKTQTTEAEILAMSTKLASAGTEMGLTQVEIMALSATLSSLGLESEAGGTAFSKMMIRIGQAVELGGEDLTNFAEVAGKSADEFADKFRESPMEALNLFIKGLGDVEGAGKTTSQMLEELSIKEVRMSDAMRRTAGSAGLLEKNVKLANDAFEENTALTTESELRFSTLSSQLQVAGNKIKASFTEAFIKMTPAIQATLDKLMIQLDKFLSLIDNMSPAQLEKMTTAFLKFSTAIVGLKVGEKALGTIKTALGGIGSVLEGTSGRFEKYTKWLFKTTEESQKAGKASDMLRWLLRPVGVEADGTSKSLTELAKGTAKASVSVGDVGKAMAGGAKGVGEWAKSLSVSGAFTKIATGATSLFGTAVSALASPLGIAVAGVGALYGAYKIYNMYAEKSKTITDLNAEALDRLSDKFATSESSVSAMARGSIKELTDKIKVLSGEMDNLGKGYDLDDWQKTVDESISIGDEQVTAIHNQNMERYNTMKKYYERSGHTITKAEQAHLDSILEGNKKKKESIQGYNDKITAIKEQALEDGRELNQQEIEDIMELERQRNEQAISAMEENIDKRKILAEKQAREEADLNSTRWQTYAQDEAKGYQESLETLDTFHTDVLHEKIRALEEQGATEGEIELERQMLMDNWRKAELEARDEHAQNILTSAGLAGLEQYELQSTTNAELTSLREQLDNAVKAGADQSAIDIIQAEIDKKEGVLKELEEQGVNYQDLLDVVDALPESMREPFLEIIAEHEALATGAGNEMDKMTNNNQDKAFENVDGIAGATTKGSIDVIKAHEKMGEDGVKGFGKSEGKMKNQGLKNTQSGIDGAKSKSGEFTTIGSQMGEGLFGGMGSWIGSMFNQGMALAQDAIAGMKAGGDIHSPSRITRDLIGKNLGLGMKIGMLAEKSNVKRAGKELVEAMFDNDVDRLGERFKGSVSSFYKGIVSQDNLGSLTKDLPKLNLGGFEPIPAIAGVNAPYPENTGETNITININVDGDAGDPKAIAREVEKAIVKATHKKVGGRK